MAWRLAAEGAKQPHRSSSPSGQQGLDAAAQEFDALAARGEHPDGSALLEDRPPEQGADQLDAGVDVVLGADALAVVLDGMDGDRQGIGDGTSDNPLSMSTRMSFSRGVSDWGESRIDSDAFMRARALLET
jgi:hypothetical protein